MNSRIDSLSLILQALSLEILFKDYNNVDLMKEIEKIIKQNDEILRILRKEE